VLGRRLSLGHVFGIRLGAHPSWFLVLGLVGFAAYGGFDEAYPLQGAPTVGVMAGMASLLFFASLVAHEAGHALLARRLGVDVRGITLFLFGGVAEIERDVESPRDEFAIALVGPTISVALGGGFALLTATGSAAGLDPLEGVAGTLTTVNALLALFNLIPGLPLDGGRLLRAGLWRLTGNYLGSTRVAVAMGRLLALALLVMGFVRLVSDDPFGLWFALVALFLDAAARATGRAAAAVALTRDEGTAPEP
jgi:Zn-dependent protease